MDSTAHRARARRTWLALEVARARDAELDGAFAALAESFMQKVLA